MFHRFAFDDDVLLGEHVPKRNRFRRKITYKIMKRFVQPNMYRLLRNGSRDEYHLADRAEEIAWELHKVLSVFEPCGDDDNRSIWLEVPRGKITDWISA